MSTRIGLSDLIRQLRLELAVAHARSKTAEGAERDIGFEVGPIDLELKFAVERDSGGSAGIKVWVVNLAFSDKYKDSELHTIKLQLTPSYQNGPINVAGLVKDTKPGG